MIDFDDFQFPPQIEYRSLKMQGELAPEIARIDVVVVPMSRQHQEQIAGPQGQAQPSFVMETCSAKMHIKRSF